MKPHVTRLYELLTYDPLTGMIQWIGGRPKVRPGQEAGGISVSKGKQYRRVKVDGVLVACHQVAWAMSYGEWPKQPLDHKNGDSLDNRISNLRLSDATRNARNRSINANNKTGVSGVRRRNGKYAANIGSGPTYRWLGTYNSIEEAAAARAKELSAAGFDERHGLRRGEG